MNGRTAQEYWSDQGAARDEILDLASSEPERFFALLPVLLATAPSDDALPILGAGPLEVFVHAHGVSFVSRLEELGERVPRLGIALGCMWPGEDEEVDRRIGRLILRAAAGMPVEGAPANAEVIARDLLGPATIVVDHESCHWSAAGTITDQKSSVIMTASHDSGEPRIVASEVPASLLTDAGSTLVAADGTNVRIVDKKSGVVTSIARGEYCITSLCVGGGRAFWTAMSVIRTCPLAGEQPTTLLIADSPRAKMGTIASALGTDGSSLYWIQAAHGEIVRATLAGDDRQYLAIGEAQPRQLQILGPLLYWVAGTGPMQIRRVDTAGGVVDTVLESSHVNAFAIDGGFVYWTDAIAGTLTRAPLSGGVTELLLSGLRNPVALRVVDQAAFTVSGTYVLRWRGHDV